MLCGQNLTYWELLFQVVNSSLLREGHSLASKHVGSHGTRSYWGLPDSTPNPSRIPPAPLNLLCHNGPSSKAAYILAWVC